MLRPSEEEPGLCIATELRMTGHSASPVARTHPVAHQVTWIRAVC